MIPELGSSVVIYTDGSCSGNGMKVSVGGWGVYVLGLRPENPSILWQDADLSSHSGFGRLDIFPGVPATNNRAELTAIIRAMQLYRTTLRPSLPQDGVRLVIKTDSNYCMLQLKKAFSGRNILAGVPNEDLLLAARNELASHDMEPTLQLIKGHSKEKDEDAFGNEQADRLARLGSGIIKT
jgi:ribonuclease HI